MSEESQSPRARDASLSNHSSPADIDNDEVKDLMDEGSPKDAKANGVRSDDDMIDDDDDDEGGLFGSGSEGEDEAPRKTRTLDDEELDSGDDVGRQDRMEDDLDNEAYEQREVLTASVSLGRHGLPKGSDGELYVIRHPNYTGIEPRGFTVRSFEPPTTSHHGVQAPTDFHPSAISNTTMRWRRSPNDPAQLESNTRLVRWSDGSLTLQIGTNPHDQLSLPAKGLAPPQKNPVTPTPISAKPSNAPYDSRKESHTYLASTHHQVGFVQLTNHVTTSLTIESSAREGNEALFKLQLSMMEAKAKEAGAEVGLQTVAVTEDPELAKRQAELADREKMRADKRRQNQEQRQRDRTGGIGRSGPRSYGQGLTAGGLEDELGGGRTKAKPKRQRRRGSEYSDDEGDYRRKTKEDEYDEDDGFLVGSDEEPEIVEDDEDEEEILGEDDAQGEEEAEQAPSRGRSPKRAREDDDEGDAATSGRRRRRVVDDDDDE